MRIVFDTNVLLAALVARGVCADLVEHCVFNHHLFSSDFILGELRGHLVGKFKYDVTDADETVALLRSQCEIVAPIVLIQPVCRDADDDQILATAVAASAVCIVNGDKDLLVLKDYKNIAIVAPADFAQFEAQAYGANP
jgi:putative PIN family toxin of toxin-antitoxin system